MKKKKKVVGWKFLLVGLFSLVFSFPPLNSCGTREIVTKGVFVWWKVIFWKSLSKLSCVCLSLEKLVNGKHFLVKGKFTFYFRRKTLSGSCEKFKNIILFADYIKFGPQTFDCYIIFFEYFFRFHLLEFNFYIKFGPHFYNCYLPFLLLFFNWNFLYIKFDHHYFDCYLFYLK
jgi:hypothetical protein